MRINLKKIAALLVGAIACLPLAAQGELTTEMYDFSSFTVNVLGLYNNNGAQADLTIGTTELFKVEGHSMYLIQDFSNEKGTFPFNGRFATEHKDAFKFRSGQKVSGVNKYTGLQARTAGMHYLSILNLAAGDKITIRSYDHNKVMQFISNNVKDYPAGTQMVSGLATYTVTEAGNVDLKIEQYGYLYSIKIETSNPQGATPSPTFKMTGTDGLKRLVTIKRGLTATDENVTTYYTTDGSDPTTATSSHFTGDEHTITIGEGATTATKVKVKAMSVSGSGRESPIGVSQEFTVGTMLSLAPVVISLTDFEADADGIYYPVYTFDNDNSQVAGAPVVTLSATFNGEPIQLTDGRFTVREPGTLRGEAKADGYATTQASLNVQQTTWGQAVLADFTAMTPADLNSADVTTVSEWRNAINGQPVYGYQIQHDLDKLAPNMKLSNNNWGLFFKESTLTTCLGVASRWGQSEMQFTLADNQIALVHVALGGVTQKPYTHQLTKGKNFSAVQYVIVQGFEIYEPKTVTNAIHSGAAAPKAVRTDYHTLTGQTVGNDPGKGLRIVTTTLSDGRTVNRKVIIR